MNTFFVTGFAFLMHELSRAKVGFIILEQTGRGSEIPSGKPKELMEKVLNEYCATIPSDLKDCCRSVAAAKTQWDDSLLNVSRACQIASRLENDLVDGTKHREFLWIASDRENLVDQGSLFGEKVASRFPSAIDDIKEAGNCLAAECCTACVFHLMRTAEVGLRALAKDRRLSFPDKPIELKEWGEILPKLDSTLAKMRGEPFSCWPDAHTKEVQLRFYNEVSQELRVFNEAWRRHISHAREDAFYDREYAADVLKHVMKFMQKLAGKISENQITSE